MSRFTTVSDFAPAFADFIARHDAFFIAAHVRPDGDAVGSCLGLAASLRAAGKTATVVLEDGLPESLDFLPGAETIITPDALTPGEAAVIALDTATRERLGHTVAAAFDDRPREWANIDHHVSNPGYGDLVLVDAIAPATGQVLYELLGAVGLPRPLATIENFFVALSTDTGSFRYPNTTARSFAIAAEMVEAGLDVGRISALTYQRRPLRQLHLLQHLFQRLRLDADGRVASWDLDMAAKNALALKPDDSEDLIDHLRGIDSVLVAVFFEELPDGKIRISSRSKDRSIDVGKVCQHFGGGGHAMAAGARMPGPLESARESFLSKIHEALPQT